MLKLENVSFSYSPDKLIIKDAAFKIKGGERVSFLGKSGEGKSTIGKIIVGLLMPDLGEVVYKNEVLPPPSSNRIMLFQENSLFPWLKVEENILLGLDNKIKNKKKLKGLAEKFNICDLLHKKAYQLSLGEKKRVEIVRGIINTPELIVCDESFSALDYFNKYQCYEYVRSYSSSEKVSLIVITHDIDESILLSDTIYFLSEGKIEKFTINPFLGSLNSRGDIDQFLNQVHVRKLKSNLLNLYYA